MANVVHNTLTDADLHASERQYAGNPNGVLTGVQGQYCEDTNTGNVYRCNGGTSWEKILDFSLAGLGATARTSLGLGSGDTPSFLSAEFGLGTTGSRSSQIVLKTFDTVDAIPIDFILKSPNGAATTGANRTLTLPNANATLAYWASGDTNNYLLTSNGSSGLVGESNLTFDGSRLTVTGAITASTVNTGLGDYELYAMNQNVRTTDSPSFITSTFGIGSAGSKSSEIRFKTYDNIDTVTVDFILTSPSTANTVSANRTLTLPDADGTLAYWASGNTNNYLVTSNGASGLVGESAITYNGSTFAVQAATIFNESGADVNFRIESDTNANMFFLDAGLNRVGIGTGSPSYTLDVNGSFRATTINTGLGDYELYAMNQDVRTTDSPSFITATFGLGTAGSKSSQIVLKTYDNVDTVTVDFILTSPSTANTVSANRTLTLPDADGTLAYWASGNTNNYLLTSNGSNGLVGESNLTFDGSTLSVTGKITANTLNTGLGDNELYAMNQNVRSTDSVTFSGLTVTNTINAQGELQENGINVARYRGGFTSAPTTDVQDGDIYTDTNFNPVRIYIRAEFDWHRIF